MNQSLLKEMYGKHAMAIIRYHQVESNASQPKYKTVLERALKIKEHVEREFNSNEKLISVSLSHEPASTHNVFCISHDIVGSKEEYVVQARGEQNSLNYLASLLHEVGHLIDFNKRGIAVAHNRTRVEELKKENLAWIYGFKFGLTFGYITREEIEECFIDCMAFLATYYKYHSYSFEEFVKIVTRIRKEVGL